MWGLLILLLCFIFKRCAASSTLEWDPSEFSLALTLKLDSLNSKSSKSLIRRTSTLLFLLLTPLLSRLGAGWRNACYYFNSTIFWLDSYTKRSLGGPKTLFSTTDGPTWKFVTLRTRLEVLDTLTYSSLVVLAKLERLFLNKLGLWGLPTFGSQNRQFRFRLPTETSSWRYRTF